MDEPLVRISGFLRIYADLAPLLELFSKMGRRSWGIKVAATWNRTGRLSLSGQLQREGAGVADNARSQMIALLPRMRRFAYSLTGDRDQADDLVQDTCTRALANLDKWQDGTRLDSWMFRIAQNLWFDRLRSKRVKGETVDVDLVHELSGVDGRDVVEARSALASVMSAMNELADDQRILVTLVCVEGLSYKEAAAVVGAPIGTVMSRLARARKALAESIGGTGPTQDDDDAYLRNDKNRVGRRGG